MNPYLITALVALAAVAIILFLRRSAASEATVTVAQVPDVAAALKKSGKDGSFAVFVFGEGGDGELNIQYSIEHGRVGLDWVLLSEPNIRDAEKFSAFAKEHGHIPKERELNKVRYLRIEGSGIDALGKAVLVELYGLKPDAAMNMIVESFDWQ